MVLDDLAEARHRPMYRHRRQGDEEVMSFITARERATPGADSVR
ncbi:hypothetical protein Rhow_005415 [Rhodococcus wratislaviensis]|uniref:Uncharacterized protein n=1 Tax=Rhodococcus wratislaviensis TaxID=44752 RepID=A0A402CDT5_RHOWR|nr:hypothetical protein Rhow_005415 [Rhodococcus wratislaviensis]